MNVLSNWTKYESLIAQGCLTNSKHPRSYVNGVYPKLIKSSYGCKIVSEDDVSYIDYICGLGTNLVGYGNEFVAKQIIKYVHHGVSPSLGTHHEMELAEALYPLFKFAEKWKFLKSGNEATLAAIKMARAYHWDNNKKTPLVLSEGFHGHGDPWTSMTPPGIGVPKDGNIEAFSDLNEAKISIASAVIIEPVITDKSPERLAWLKKLRELCTKHNTVLIFDEIITGFRFKNHSVAKNTGIKPDLVVIGKAMANGLPLTAIGGRKEIMDGKYFVSSTFAGDILSLVAAKAVIHLLKNDSKYDIERLWIQGQRFQDEFNSLSDDIKIVGYPTRGRIEGNERSVALFFQEMCNVGVLFGKSWFYNFDLMNVDDYVLDCAGSIIKNIKLGKYELKGEAPKAPIADQVRKNGKN